MRCKACNNELHDWELFSRVVVVDGIRKRVPEELCRDCRKALFHDLGDESLSGDVFGIDTGIDG